MRRLVGAVVSASAVAAVLVTAEPVSAVAPTCPSLGTSSNPVCFAWQGEWTQQAVNVPSLTPGTAAYSGQVFLPAGPVAGPRPAVAVLHGLTGRMEHLWYLARDLAGHGFVVVTVTNPGSTAESFTDAMRSMQTYLLAQATALSVNPNRIGVAGHSAGARATALVQSQTDLVAVRAAVALDNLQSTQEGDAGSAVYNPTCLGGPQTPIAPRVPALGIAMDAQSWTCSSAEPEVKKTAWKVWRAAGLPTVEVVDKGTNHYSFAQLGQLGQDATLHAIAYLTRSWFQRWLMDDAAAVDRMLDPRAELGVARDALLSSAFRSAAYLPDRGVDCPDLIEAACSLS